MGGRGENRWSFGYPSLGLVVSPNRVCPPHILFGLVWVTCPRHVSVRAAPSVRPMHVARESISCL